jgi:tetratricopeptide (TPR) repeat protein
VVTYSRGHDRVGRFDEADVVLGEAVGSFPDHFWLARTRALIARDLGDDVEAYTRCRALRQRFPDNPAAHAAFAHLLLDLKLVAAAEAEAKAGLVLFPNVIWLQHMYARCADQAGDTAAAAIRWTDLLVRHPDHEPAYSAAVCALIGAGRFDEATVIAREGHRLFPSGGSAHDALAEASQVKSVDATPAPTTELAEDLLTGALSSESAGKWVEAARLWALLRERAP